MKLQHLEYNFHLCGRRTGCWKRYCPGCSFRP